MNYNPQDADPSEQGGGSRSREPSHGLCHAEVAILVVLFMHKKPIRQVDLVEFLAQPFAPDSDIYARIWKSRGQNIYTSCGKLSSRTKFNPPLIKCTFNPNGISITEAGRDVLQKILAFHPRAADLQWLFTTYYAERDAHHNPKLVDADDFLMMGHPLPGSARRKDVRSQAADTAAPPKKQ